MDVYRKISKCPKCNKGIPGNFVREGSDCKIFCGYCGHTFNIPVSETLIHFTPESCGCDFEAILKIEGHTIKKFTVTETHSDDEEE